MKAYLLSDNIDTRVGMRLAGIEGIIIHTKEEVLKQLEILIKEKDVGLILITEKLAALVGDKIEELKLNMSLPLITEIPDRHGTIRGKEAITHYVKESIGLKI